jgi:class 3 adenylate cyclase
MQQAIDAAILFADIVGSTRLYEQLGDAAALAVISQCLEAMGQGLPDHGGRIVKTIGDEIMVAYAGPADGFRSAMDLRRRVAALPPVAMGGASVRLRVRIGLHFGAALAENGDLFGDAVNVAARLTELASASQILTTGELLAHLPANLRSLATEFAEIEVKGRDTPIRIARVADDTAVQENTQVRFEQAAPAPAVPSLRLALRLNGQPLRIDAGTRRLVFGREADCDVLLAGALASRRHATIEWRRDKIVLADHSTNGTVLQMGDGRSVHLRREEFGLMGAGRIVFGRPDAPDADVLDFRLD